ncbi:MAG: hypothetical protein ACI9MR_001043 [Myxococcota bacterium]|jgi:hypothetical protein
MHARAHMAGLCLLLMLVHGCSKDAPTSTVAAASPAVAAEAEPATSAESSPTVVQPGTAAAETAPPATAPDDHGPLVKCYGDLFKDPGGARNPTGVAWDHQFWCLKASSPGRYTLRFKLTYADTFSEPLTLESLSLEKVTPRPLQRAWVEKHGEPNDSFTVAESLPMTVQPGGEAILTISGRHILEKGDEPDKRANLHFELFATRGTQKQASLGFSIHTLSSSEPETDGNGPPAHRGGSGSDDQRGKRGPNKRR